MDKIIEIISEKIRKVEYDEGKYEYEISIQYNKLGEKAKYLKTNRANDEEEAKEILKEFKQEFIDDGYTVKYKMDSIKEDTIGNAKIIKEKIEKSDDEYIVYFYHKDIDKEDIIYTIDRAATEEEAKEKLKILKNNFELRNKEMLEKRYDFIEKEIKPENISHEEYKKISDAIKNEEKLEISDNAMQEYNCTNEYDFKELYTHGWKNFTNFSGKSNRSEYWTFALVNGSIGLILSLIHVILGMIFAFAILIPQLSIAIRRLRDAGKHPADICWALVPLVGWIVSLVNLCSPTIINKEEKGEQSTFLKWLPILIFIAFVIIMVNVT